MCTNIIAIASVDKVDTVWRLTSSIHHALMFRGLRNDKTAQHINHIIN